MKILYNYKVVLVETVSSICILLFGIHDVKDLFFSEALAILTHAIKLNNFPHPDPRLFLCCLEWLLFRAGEAF